MSGWKIISDILFFLAGNAAKGLDKGTEKVYTPDITIEQVLNQ